MRPLLLLPVLLLLAACAHTSTRPGQAVPMFDGKTLTGWEGNRKIFRVRDGAIVGGYISQTLTNNEFLCTTRQYTNFVLKAKFKLVGGEKANAGVQFRSQRIPNHWEVSGYQADVGQQYWGALYDESRRRKTLVQPKAEDLPKIVRYNDWNDYEIRADGKHIVLKLNGYTTVDYTEPDDAIPQYGIIGVQIHAGPPSEALYKNITIRELP